MDTSSDVLPSRPIIVYLRDVSPFFAPWPACGPSSMLFLPSSQTAATRPPGIGSRETKPCSAFDLSPCGITGLLQLLPPSEERDSRMLDSCVPGVPFTGQCAINSPPGPPSSDGKSAQLARRSSPSIIVRGSDQPPALRTAKRSA